MSGRFANELRHKAIIDRFDRFPHRNAVLGRASTPENSRFFRNPGLRSSGSENRLTRGHIEMLSVKSACRGRPCVCAKSTPRLDPVRALDRTNVN